MGGSGSDTKTDNTVRYAPYIETYHKAYLQMIQAARFNAAEVSVNPYTQFETPYYEEALFGIGFTMIDFPSLYDMFGKFMAGLDLESLFNEHFEDTVNGPVIDDVITQEGVRLSDELEQEVIPRYEVGMRDINSVMSSTFLIGKTLLEESKTKTLAKYSADVRFKVIPLVTERWRGHLAWNELVVKHYAEIMKFAMIVRGDADNLSMETNSKAALWPFNAIQYETAAIGAVSGASNTHSETAGHQGGSRVQRALGGAAAGAAAGAAGGPIGMLLGGIIGLGAGLLGGK